MVRSAAQAGEVKSGGGLLEAGLHHCIIEDCKEAEKSDYGAQVHVELLCLASSDPAQVGKKRGFFLSVEGERAWQWWQFAVAAGLATQAEYDEFKKNGGVREFNEADAIGRQVCLELKLNKWKAGPKSRTPGEEKQEWQWGSNIWAPDDPKAANVPKEPKAHAMYMSWKAKVLAAGAPAGSAPTAGHGAAGANGNGNAGGHSQAAPQSAPQPAAAGAAAGASPGGDEWGAF